MSVPYVGTNLSRRILNAESVTWIGSVDSDRMIVMYSFSVCLTRALVLAAGCLHFAKSSRVAVSLMHQTSLMRLNVP